MRFATIGLFVLALAACGGESEPLPEPALASVATTLPPVVTEPVPPDMVLKTEAQEVMERAFALVTSPEVTIPVVLQKQIDIGNYNSYLSTGSFVWPVESAVWKHIEGSEESFDVSGFLREQFRQFLKNPDNVRLVGRIALEHGMGFKGDMTTFLRNGQRVLSAKIEPLPGVSAGEWYAAFRNHRYTDPAPDINIPPYAAATAKIKEIIPDLNLSAVSLYIFLHRRLNEGGDELVRAYQEVGRDALK